MDRLTSKRATNGGGNYFTEPAPTLRFIRSGCTLLDCALSGGRKGAYPFGRMVNIVGDKSTGKTLLGIEACATTARDFPKALIWYREAESAFDKGYANALGMPVDRVDFGKHRFETVEQIFDDLSIQLKRAASKNVPGLYIIDSLDALSDEAEMNRDIDEGSFGAQKAKKMSELFRRKIGEIESSQVCVMIISQIRDKIGAMFGEKHSRSGGKAMDFYASQVLKLAHIETIYKTIKGVKRAVGIRIKAKVTKNKIGLPLRECEFVIRFGFGIENYEAGMQWLIETGHTDALGLSKERAQKMIGDSMDWGLEEYMENNSALDAAVRATWREVETSFLPTRRKYSNG